MTESIRIPSPDQPADAFAAVLAMRRLATMLERSAVDAALGGGWTWAEIGAALDMTPQAAHKRLAPTKRTNLRKDS